jgi:uncharacterized protein (TIGR02001 family)
MRKAFHKGTSGILALSVALILGVVSISPALAEEEMPSTDFSVALLSKYVWRGQELSKDSIVVQPSMTVGYKGFAANLWGNLDTDPYDDTSKENWNETDFTLSYGKEVGMVSAEAGWIYYGLDGADDTYELYLNLGLDVLLAPTLTIYRDISSYKHTYFLAGISHAFALTETISLELGGSVSYLSSDDEDEYPEYNDQLMSTGDKFSNFHDGVISASLPIALGEYFTITPTVSYVFPLSSDAKNDMKARSQNGEDDNFFFGGLTCNMAF